MNNTFVHIHHPNISSLFHHYFIIVSKKSNDYLLNNIILFNKFFSVFACQRYLCPYVIPMTMNAFIFKNLSLKTVLLNQMSK